MSDVTVTFDNLQYPGGAPRAFGKVSVRLLAAGGGGVIVDGAIIDAQPVTLDDTGSGSIVLARNSDITPAGTFYRVTVERSSPTATRAISLTSETADTVAWTDAGIQLLEPVPPSFLAENRVLPDPVLQTLGQVLTVTGDPQVWSAADPSGGGSFGPWNPLLDEYTTATLPGWCKAETISFPTGLQWRTTPLGQIEVGGFAIYLANNTPYPDVPTAPSVIATLPPEALPAVAPQFVSYQVNALGDLTTSLTAVGIDPSTGAITLESVATYSFFGIPNFTFDPA